ncbi:hypothetical protein BHE74_00030638 [Ensete ventricosum]|uniref:Uncharacterized protein n=1 Tax=Ensete ventricosum TaxID=4639 RepID=A0A445MAB8_ENSVE|nr:hypothetical protein BHE74_00030638 [Ensete ventricosum]RZR71144.1 hypothetical protein BHM03_00003841 [Ensete ventricosum]
MSEVSGADKSIVVSEYNTLYHFWKRSRIYPINTRVEEDMSNKIGLYRKHMRNSEIYMCQI